MIRSDYIINKIAAAFHIESTDKDSVYTDFCSKDGNNRRVRFSNHGVILSTWYKHLTEPYQLNKSKNIALTFLMTKDECKEKNVTFSTSAVNKTKVLNDLGIPIDDNFKVMHYIYLSWKIEEAHIELIIKAIDSFIKTGNYIDPLSKISAKATVFDDTSNLPPKKIKNKVTTPNITNIHTDDESKKENSSKQTLKYKEKKSLYESIMYDIAKIVKLRINRLD